MSEQTETQFDLKDRLSERRSSYDDTSMAQVNAMSAERAELFARLGVFDTADVISMVESLRRSAQATAATSPEPAFSASRPSLADDQDIDVVVPVIDIQHLANRMGDVGPTVRRLQESMAGLDERRTNHVAEIARLRQQIEAKRAEITNVDGERIRLATRLTSIADAVSNLDGVIGSDW
jgi:hypothetical protein